MTSVSQQAGLSLILELLHKTSRRFQHGESTDAPSTDVGDNVTLFGAAGGCVAGEQAVQSLWHNAAVHLGGSGATAIYEVLSSHIEDGLAYVAAIERIARPDGRVIVLRVTSVFRCFAGEWQLVHRHADPYRESPFEAQHVG